ncbi:CHAT domain-containing protein [Cupriavidus sp. AcVe19-6a]|uniref:CHAT domain-containing protein n=1 Tax=Cupriavidus sp. AcVe19-6a TaxID=2821358 RepID=UPI001AE853D1|nr:CHAT domain-containing protein [Cupriavidus sp. AcVe19-6a]MBP0639448.1 CHAT domain-containing protein [Cupriavidus sp. AcVe19-6a]
MTTSDFDLRISADDGRYWAEVVDSPVGRSRREALQAPFGSDPRDRALFLLQLENAVLRGGGRRGGPVSREEKVLRDFGSKMFRILLSESGSVATTYSASRASVNSLRLKLTVDPPELAVLPWEFLFEEKQHSSAQDYLCLNDCTPIVRYLDFGHIQQHAGVTGKLNILGMIANPRGEWTPLDVERERQRIDRAVAEIPDKDAINFQWVQGQTQEDLLDIMQKEEWHVFHFIGHGGVSEWIDFDGNPQSEGFVVLADGQGGAVRLTAAELAMSLSNRSRSLRLAVLNCCESARGTGADSPGAAIVKSGVPAVVAMQYPICDETAITFASMFYRSLLNGRSVEDALTAARKLMHRESAVEWGIPVLFTCADSSPLIVHRSATAFPAPPSPPSPAASPVEPRGGPPAEPAEHQLQQDEARAALRRLFSTSGPPGIDHERPTPRTQAGLGDLRANRVRHHRLRQTHLVPHLRECVPLPARNGCLCIPVDYRDATAVPPVPMGAPGHGHHGRRRRFHPSEFADLAVPGRDHAAVYGA